MTTRRPGDAAYRRCRHLLHQPELPRDQRVERFMDRMGNILWRERGQDVFLITLHRPWMYRAGERLGTYAFLKTAEDTAEGRYQRMQALRTWVRSVRPLKTLRTPSCMSVVIPSSIAWTRNTSILARF